MLGARTGFLGSKLRKSGKTKCLVKNDPYQKLRYRHRRGRRVASCTRFLCLDVGRAPSFADGGATYFTTLATAYRTAHVGDVVPGEVFPACLSRGCGTLRGVYTDANDTYLLSARNFVRTTR